MLLDFSLPIEEVCGRVRTHLGVSGFAQRISTAGRDGKTHKVGDRKRHVVLLLRFSGGIKGCGDILVLTVCQPSPTTQLALNLRCLSPGDLWLSTAFYHPELRETFSHSGAASRHAAVVFL